MKFPGKLVRATFLARGIMVAAVVFVWSVSVGGVEPTPFVSTARPERWAVAIKKEGLPNLYKVSDTLYRGAQPTRAGFAALEEMGVKTVVNLRSFHSDKSLLKATKLRYEHMTMKAWHAEEKEVLQFLKLVTDPKQQPVFVHCLHGADRTGTMCAVYRVVVQDWSKEEAVREMKDGGYGFFDGWQNLVKFVHGLDVETLRQKAGQEGK